MMRCDDARLALSARLDGELLAVDTSDLDHHLAACAECRRYEADLASLRRAGLAVAPPIPPTLPEQVLAAIEPDRSTSPQARTLRVALVTVAIAQAAIAIPELFHAGGGLTAHQTRHLGVFSIALAAGFLFTALRPRRVGALLPLAAVLAGGLVLTGVLDAAAGRTPIAGESTHLLEVLGLVLLWMLTRIERPRPATSTRSALCVARDPATHPD
jgi:predicted anti-sigma-YlaC factor YlaD